jgi:hypothetical protein
MQEETEVPCAAVYTVRAVRPEQSGVSQIQDLPHLFQKDGQRRQDTRSEEGQLVGARNWSCAALGPPGLESDI